MYCSHAVNLKKKHLIKTDGLHDCKIIFRIIIVRLFKKILGKFE